jgi:hypothetical protein
VTKLLNILLGTGDDEEIATRIRNACVTTKLTHLGKRIKHSSISELQARFKLKAPLRKRDKKR